MKADSDQKNIDQLIFTAVFSQNEEEKKKARSEIRKLAEDQGIKSSSIYNFYMAIGAGKVPPNFTVPAINIRALTYDTARIIFRLMIKRQIGPVIFEIAKSEIEYTDQRPDEYTSAVLAAAIKEGYIGPVFLQGDHFQFNQKKYAENPDEEINKIKDLIKEAILGGFKNTDIDASTLVDLTKSNLNEQQEENYKVTSLLTSYIRSLEQGTTISIGGEIGHIGGKNSNSQELEAFMEGYLRTIGNIKGLSKISVQTGTSHGGIPLPNGKIADVKLDFDVIEKTGKTAREKYHLGGVVQHGASTLPAELFSEFPKHKTLEIHLATGFQNIVFDNIPAPLRDEIYAWLSENHQPEWDESLTREQNIYKTRKRAIGQFKKKLWELSDEEKQPIIESLENQLAFLFEKLNVFKTRENLLKYV
ncbi:MAG: class II fructose-bisphosphate aldolase [Candidatus Levybacteria bacterium]|nr:class II fructose-bisphosphate aldolase [Candidatus Levybacteria bacterium]